MNNENITPVKKPISIIQLMIMGLIIALFSINRATTNLPISAITLVVFSYGVYKLCKNKKLLAIVLLIVGGVLFVASPETIDSSIIITSAYVSLIGAIAIGGFMMGNGTRGIALYVAFMAIAYVGAYIASGSTIMAIEVFRTLPCAIVLAVCKNKKASRLTALCSVSVAFLASLYLPEIVIAIMKYGSQTLEQIKTAISVTRDEIIKEAMAISTELGSEETGIYSPEIIKSIITLIFNILPALLITMSNAIVFFTQSFFFALSENFDISISKEERAFEPSLISAWMFFISFAAMFIAAFFDAPSAEVISLSMMNINIILIPAFLVTAVLSFVARIRKTGMKFSPFTVIIIALAVINFGTLLLYPVAGFGAVSTIKKFKKIDNSKNSNPNISHE